MLVCGYEQLCLAQSWIQCAQRAATSQCGLCCQHALAMQGSSAPGCLLQTLSSEFSSARFSLPVPQGHPLALRSGQLPVLGFPL